MPPVMMTKVMPSAMIATKVKLRVMLKRFVGVQEGVRPPGQKRTGDDDGDNDPEGLAAQQALRPGTLLLGDGLFERHCHDYTCSIAPVMRPVTSSGELSLIRLSATLRPRRSTIDPVANGEHVGHTMADQHDRDPLIAQMLDVG